jgi:LacI family transcriptional regulator
MFSGPESLNFLSNPIFIELFRPVVETLNASGINVYTEVTTDLEEAERLASHAYGGSSAVIILIGTRLSDAVLESLSRTLPVPIITVVRRPLPGANVGVAVCNFEIGAMAAAHLLELGHRRIGYIGANPGVQLGEERLEGFRDQFASREILLDERWIRAGDFYQESGRLALLESLELGEVTAVFAANDLMAIGALEACKERDVEVPGQMSILGCDNIPNLDLLSVPLSTIALPVREMGVLAARQAESILNGERPEAPVVLHAKLLLRESTAPLQAAQK